MVFTRKYNYKYVCSDRVNHFNKDVNDHLDKGWDVHGSPNTKYNTGYDYGHLYCQAMIKYLESCPDSSSGVSSIFTHGSNFMSFLHHK
jgi:hypothetical protein